MKSLARSTPFLVILLCALLLILGGGCSSKKPVLDSRQAKSPIDEPTQRPYSIKGITYYPIPSAEGYVERGKASWYGKRFHGKKTASGEVYDMYGQTAAHKTLPMNTVLLVKNLDNGRSTLVRVNDRGPFSKERVLDLSYGKASELGIVGSGVARVEIMAMEQHAKGKAPPVLASVPKRQQSGKVAASKTTAANVRSYTGKKIAKIKVRGQKIPASIPASAPTHIASHGKFYVQVGAFNDLHAARTMAKNFANKGKDVTIQQYPAAGKEFYRVLVFAGTSLTKARTLEQKLKGDGFRYALLLAR